MLCQQEIYVAMHINHVVLIITISIILELMHINHVVLVITILIILEIIITGLVVILSFIFIHRYYQIIPKILYKIDTSPINMVENLINKNGQTMMMMMSG